MTAKRTTRNNRESYLCQFPFADGRRCRMLRRDHPSLCPFHARAEQQLRESHQLGSEISSTLTGNFLTATDINFALGKVFTAVAQNRIPPRNAAILAYLGQLLLHSISGVKKEFTFGYSFEQWKRMLTRAVPLSPPGPIHSLDDDSAAAPALASSESGSPPDGSSDPES